MTLKRATEAWVSTFNAIQQGMIEKLIINNLEEWQEVTTPSCNNRIYHFDSGRYGIINEIHEDTDNDEITYIIELDNDDIIKTTDIDDFEVENDAWLPMWGTMWSFGDSADDYWFTNEDGIRIMSECGFRIYEHEEFGYFFGIDGAGYDFYENHWMPLYIRRGMKWHKDEDLTDDERKMIENV